MWINLAHVCGTWRSIVFTSSSRLDLGITIGPIKPCHIKTILSGPLPIFIDYKDVGRLLGSAFWRMRAALKQHDRVREISIDRMGAKFDKFFKETQCAFPALKSLSICFRYDYKPKLPDTFLRGRDPSNLCLRRLKLERTSLASISGFLLSATALTNLSLQIDTAFGPSAETSLLACLQGMPCLRHLYLSLSYRSVSQPLTSGPKDIVLLSRLTWFRFVGHSIFLDALVAGFSAPSLRDVDLTFLNRLSPLIVHLPRFINEIKEHYHAVHVVFQGWQSHIWLLTRSEYDNHCAPRFKFGPVLILLSELIIQMSSALSARLTTVEELRVTFSGTDAGDWDSIPWRGFFHRFPNVKAIRTEGRNSSCCIARTLFQDHGEPDDCLAFLPALEEVELGKDPSRTPESQSGPELAAFQPFVSARKRAGRPVKVLFSPQLESVGYVVDEL